MIKDRESFEHVVKYVLAKNFRLDESEIKKSLGLTPPSFKNIDNQNQNEI